MFLSLANSEFLKPERQEQSEIKANINEAEKRSNGNQRKGWNGVPGEGGKPVLPFSSMRNNALQIIGGERS